MQSGLGMPSCAVSVDLDEVHHYAAVHGLSGVPALHAVYDTALPRMREFARELGVPLTVFAVAADLRREENVLELRRVLAAGHELGNHSLDHLYDLTRREISEQRRQVEQANALFESVLGVRVTGFRAPGYTVTDELLGIVRDAGMAYDSSVFPCPPYFAAKAAVLGALRVRGKHSRSILDSPRVLAAPTSPYRVGQPYWTRGSGLLELPIQVAGPLRVPFIGTTLTLLGPSAARLLTRAMLGLPFVNLELHGIDFLEARDVPEALHAVQAGLRVPWSRKRETFCAVLELLRRYRFTFVRLADAARAF